MSGKLARGFCDTSVDLGYVLNSLEIINTLLPIGCLVVGQGYCNARDFTVKLFVVLNWIKSGFDSIYVLVYEWHLCSCNKF